MTTPLVGRSILKVRENSELRTNTAMQSLGSGVERPGIQGQHLLISSCHLGQFTSPSSLSPCIKWNNNR